jgi:hypothetical protein
MNKELRGAIYRKQMLNTRGGLQPFLKQVEPLTSCDKLKISHI